MDRAPRLVPDMDDELVLGFRGTVSHRMDRLAAGIEGDLAQLRIQKLIGFVLDEFVRCDDRGTAKADEKQRGPEQRGYAQGHHRFPLATIHPAPRTLRIRSLSNFLRRP